ncbi:MAG: hypothetical protein ISN64_01635 [Rickettsia sp.]|nr:hypothetical protein [Rickettsia sp.]
MIKRFLIFSCWGFLLFSNSYASDFFKDFDEEFAKKQEEFNKKKNSFDEEFAKRAQQIAIGNVINFIIIFSFISWGIIFLMKALKKKLSLYYISINLGIILLFYFLVKYTFNLVILSIIFSFFY